MERRATADRAPQLIAQPTTLPQLVGQPASVEAIEQAAASYGVAPGGKAMMRAESRGARRALASGVYIVWRSKKTGADCARVASESRCLCGHSLAAHGPLNAKNPRPPACGSCACRRFEFVPSRPEECGMWWLPRRKGFNVHTWRAPCKCGHGHDAHDPSTGRCRSCGCNAFVSNYCCIGCDGSQEEHETVFELEEERRAEGRPVGAAFEPLHGMSAELRREAGIGARGGVGGGGGAGGAGGAGGPSPSPEEQFERGLISAAQYHQLVKAEAAADARCGGGGGSGAGAAPPRVRTHAPPTVRACTLDLGGGQSVTALTNLGPPDPGNGRRDWTREWQPAAPMPRGARDGAARARKPS